ncbi:Alpha/Beta hydrolase protein [Copromyces sp. CBS 386.78]|nr:Alpha/Beta hydrolase protein [Copromyces sp. CBS 386.78]
MIITNTLLFLISFATIPVTAQSNQKPLLASSNHNKMAHYDEDTIPSSPSRRTPVLDPTDNSTIIGHHYPGFDYTGEGIWALQTLDLWFPVGAAQEAPWLVYIHGGAWRDPAIDSSSFNASATKILSTLFQQPLEQRKKKLGGIASINYRLSPYPNHTTNPSDDPTDDSRRAKHPDHIADVLTALDHLHKFYLMQSYVLVGHSCGATLALQACMDPVRWKDLEESVTYGYRGLYEVAKPKTVVGLNGLYDLAGFIDNPPKGYERLREAYREFVTGAFGSDEKVWREACPASAERWLGQWKLGHGEGKRKVVLVQSLEDSLVPVEQTELMAAYLEKENEQLDEDNKIEVAVLMEKKGGDHDEIWQRGDRLGEILVAVLDGEI